MNKVMTILTLCLVLFLCGTCTSQRPLAENILGKWRVVENKNPSENGTVYEFKQDGTCDISSSSSDSRVSHAKYKLQETHIEITVLHRSDFVPSSGKTLEEWWVFLSGPVKIEGDTMIINVEPVGFWKNDPGPLKLERSK
jgi:hypothetical protein